MRRDGSIYDTELHSSMIYRQLYHDGHHLHVEEHLHIHANIQLKKKKTARGKKKKVYMEKGGNF